MKKTRPSKPSAVIRDLRERAGLTQREAAARCGYSHSAIQKFESGRRTPPARSIPHIIARLSLCQHGCVDLTAGGSLDAGPVTTLAGVETGEATAGGNFTDLQP